MAERCSHNQIHKDKICLRCQEYCMDPVTTDCGHTFCRDCLTRSWGEPDRNASCPECRAPVVLDNLRLNQSLPSIVDKIRTCSRQVAKRAGRVCDRHQEPLKLFCRDDRTPICMVCHWSKEHKEHQVIPVVEAAEEYKDKIQEQVPFLETEREKLEKQKDAEEQRNQKYLKWLGKEKQEITTLFEKTHKSLKEKEHLWLKELADLEEEIEKRQEKNMTKLSEEISHFNNLIKDVELHCQQPPAEFLQDITCTLSRYQQTPAITCLELSPRLEWRLKNECQKSVVLKKAMEKFEGLLKKTLSKVNVTLDLDTAHPWLALSDELKSVSYGNNKQNMPHKSERFDTVTCVLGRERFKSGRHWWEVEVEVKVEKEREWWVVGIARESLRRKGHFVINPHEGIWAVGKAPMAPLHLCAFTSPEWTPLTLSHMPGVIRVLLDYEKGSVEFFDADTDSPIFTFPPGSFSESFIRPFFSLKEGVSLKC